MGWDVEFVLTLAKRKILTELNSAKDFKVTNYSFISSPVDATRVVTITRDRGTGVTRSLKDTCYVDAAGAAFIF